MMTANPSAGFQWFTHNALPLVPASWASQLLEIAERHAVFRMLESSSVTSREESSFLKIPSYTVDGTVVRDCAPWLYRLYHNEFRDLAERAAGVAVECAKEDLYGAVLNVQDGREMRYECHVDSNPIQGLLYVTSHAPGTGGELVVARNPNAHSTKEVDADCELLYPVSGRLIFFDGRQWPHYVRALETNGPVRVVVAMNFYTADCPESNRPGDLNEHLFGRSG